MSSGLWIALVAGGLVGGIGVVALLALPAGREFTGGIGAVAGFVLFAWALGRLASELPSANTPTIAIALGMGAFVGGYSLASAVLPQAAQGHTAAPPITPSKGNRTALLVLSDAEPEVYSPSATATELLALQDDDVLSLGLLATPFLFAAQKARYKAIGGISPARRQVREITEALEHALEGLGVEHCGAAWCSGPANLRDQVDDLARAGYSQIVVLPLGIGESMDVVRAKTALDRSRPQEARVHVVHGAPLGSSDDLAGLVARRISVGLHDPAHTGVALVAHGQPQAREELNPSFDEAEAAFVNRVKMLFAESELPVSNIRLAWTDWRDPDVTSTIRHLAALGCTRILVCPACYAVEGLATLLDLPLSVRQARTDPSGSVVTLSAWRDEADAIGALRTKALEALNDLEESVAGSA